MEGSTDEELSAALRGRLRTLGKRANFTSELLSVDAAASCLEEADQEEVRRQQPEAKDRVKEEAGFRERFRTRRAEHRVSSAKTAAAKLSAKKMQWKGPTRMPPLATMSQSEAKALMPPAAPKSWLWRAHTTGSWNTRVAEMPVCSRTDSANGGEMGALRLVVPDAWKQWLLLSGFTEGYCPIQGMFDVIDPRSWGSGSGGAASSSQAVT